jgi:hypothetical protein
MHLFNVFHFFLLLSICPSSHPPPCRPLVYLFLQRSFLSFIHHSYRLLFSSLISRFIHPPIHLHTHKHTHTHIHPPILPSLYHSHRRPSSTICPSCHPCITIKQSILWHRQTCFLYVIRVIVRPSYSMHHRLRFVRKHSEVTACFIVKLRCDVCGLIESSLIY